MCVCPYLCFCLAWVVGDVMPPMLVMAVMFALLMWLCWSRYSFFVVVIHNISQAEQIFNHGIVRQRCRSVCEFVMVQLLFSNLIMPTQSNCLCCCWQRAERTWDVFRMPSSRVVQCVLCQVCVVRGSTNATLLTI